MGNNILVLIGYQLDQTNFECGKEWCHNKPKYRVEKNIEEIHKPYLACEKHLSWAVNKRLHEESN